MARRRHEHGLKYQQRIESEQQRNRRLDEQPQVPAPSGVTQRLETAAPPAYVPRATDEPHDT